ncbi:hypothetical protein TrLO_g3006 [Triparma laevis f. longispina]|uniref:DOMON domain-containing protein n=1 Tax=Triparma laevis f. longispina TaxID=1714387 RepID=A0A9W7CBZ6_9STRA|nr:hypothetical protein TrLO_g3006 [Triparma laevis f. longispina]
MITITFTVSPKGWVGFGIGPGGMKGADLVATWISDSTSEIIVKDMYSLENGMPIDDDCSSWVATQGVEDDDKTQVTLRRMLDTGDEAHDRVIVNNGLPTRILLAYGHTDAMTYHGTKRVATEIDFWNHEDTSSSRKLDGEDTTGVELDAMILGDHPMTSTDTEYIDNCVSYDDFDFPADVDIIYITRITAVIAEDTSKYVHHFIGQVKDSCSGPDAGQFYAWAPGAGVKQWPTGYGQPFRRGEVILLEVHYDNPDGSLAVGLVDKSGIDFVYQLEEPEHGAVTTISMGDVLVNEDETIGEGVSSYTYRCDGTCFRDEQPAKIWYVGLHGHLAAEFIQLRQFRGEVEINRWEEEFYNFNFQGALKTPPGVTDWEIHPGDEFEVQCIYNSDNENLHFGEASNDEMCIAFVTILAEYNTQACVWMHPETVDISGGVLDCFYDCPNQKSFPAFPGDEEMSGKRFCSFLESTYDHECTQDCLYLPYLVSNAVGCNTIEYGVWGVDEEMNDVDAQFCSQSVTAEIEHDVEELLVGARKFGNPATLEAQGTCAFLPEGGLEKFYVDELLLKGGGVRWGGFWGSLGFFLLMVGGLGLGLL